MSLLLATLVGLPALPSITVHVVPHEEQRYDTAGDWVWKDGGLVVTVSDLGDPRFNLMVAAHEITEALLCRRDGVAEADVDAWDLSHSEAEEPGEVEGAPYFTQHAEASRVERMLADLMQVDWDEYSRAFEGLGEA